MAHRVSKALDTFSSGDVSTLLRSREHDRRQEESFVPGMVNSARATNGLVEPIGMSKPATMASDTSSATTRGGTPYPRRSTLGRSTDRPFEPRPERSPQRLRVLTPSTPSRRPSTRPKRYGTSDRRANAVTRKAVPNKLTQDGPRSTVLTPRRSTTERVHATAPASSKARGRTSSRGVFSRLQALVASVLQWFFDLKPRARHAIVGVSALLLVVGFFYAPAADLYAALRDHQQLERQSAQAQEQLQNLEERVTTLQSEEGIIDEARIRGYVLPGEHAADATELLGEDDGAKPPPYSLEQDTPDDPFYIQLLDKLLGYQGPRS